MLKERSATQNSRSAASQSWAASKTWIKKFECCIYLFMFLLTVKLCPIISLYSVQVSITWLCKWCYIAWRWLSQPKLKIISFNSIEMQRQNTAFLSQLSFHLTCQIKKLALLYWIRVNTVCPRNSEIRGKQVLNRQNSQ